MARLLLALTNDDHQQTTLYALPSAIQVSTLNALAPDEPASDISLVDLQQWEEVGAVGHWPEGQNGSRLLLVTTEELRHLSPAIRERIDGLITLPVNAPELAQRLRNLLQMQDRGDIRHRIYNTLAVTNKAIQSTSDAIIIADDDGVSLYVNPAFTRLFGYSVNELNVEGIPATLFRVPAIGERVFSTVREQGSWNGEVELKTRANGDLPILLNIDSIRDDQDISIGFISICTDITNHKRLIAIQQEQQNMVQAQLDTAKALTSTLNLNEVFERILDNLSRVVPNDAANIILIQDGHAHLVHHHGYGRRARMGPLSAGELPVDAYDDLRRILSLNAPLVIPNTREYLNKHGDMATRTPWLHSHLGIPIRLRERIIGFLNVDNARPGLFNQEHAERLQLFAEQAAIAIHNARLHERAKKLAMMEERQRLARNLHDAVSQMLFSASIIAEALPHLWRTNPDAVLARLEQIRTLNRGALDEMRSLLMELHPERLVETEMGRLIQQLADSALGQARLDITLDLMEQLKLPSDVHIAVYYITQEALNNVVKHAEATQVTIHLRKVRQKLRLAITDNGRGFDSHHIPSTSMGLSNIRERAQSTGGKLTLVSAPGRGTQVSITWSTRRSRER